MSDETRTVTRQQVEALADQVAGYFAGDDDRGLGTILSDWFAALPTSTEGLYPKSGETYPKGWGCPCCDGTGFVSDELADVLRAKGSFPPDRLASLSPSPTEENPE